MTITDLLSSTNTIDRLDAELLLAHVMKQPREFFIAHGDELVKGSHKFQFQRLVKKRELGLPVAYITGHKAFYGLDFFVSKDTLVPRPDTELMVDLAVSRITKDSGLIDVGTGTGCIPIAILKSLSHTVKTVAIDISSAALKVAKKNATQHSASIFFFQGSLLSPIQKLSIFNPQSSIVITANLPYLTQKEINESPSIQKEPHLALYADDHGLALYKELLQQVHGISQMNPQFTGAVLMEISPWQSKLLQNYCRSLFPEAEVAAHRDLSDKDRVISLDLT